MAGKEPGKDSLKKPPPPSPKTASKLSLLTTAGAAGKPPPEPAPSAAFMADIRTFMQDIKTGQNTLLTEMQKLEVGQRKLEEGLTSLRTDFQRMADSQQNMDLRLSKAETELGSNEKRITINEIEIKTINIQQEDILDRMAMVEMKVKEAWLRIRGLPESEGKQDLKDYITNMLAALLKEEDVGAISGTITTVYRLNSRFAREKNLPRDIIVQFASKQYRDLVLSSHFESPITICDKKLMLMKEIPLRILRKRKDFFFLTEVLKRNQIPFRWLFPQGLAFKFNSNTFTILNVSRARHFLHRYGERLGYSEPALEEDLEFQASGQGAAAAGPPAKRTQRTLTDE